MRRAGCGPGITVPPRLQSRNAAPQQPGGQGFCFTHGDALTRRGHIMTNMTVGCGSHGTYRRAPHQAGLALPCPPLTITGAAA